MPVQRQSLVHGVVLLECRLAEAEAGEGSRALLACGQQLPPLNVAAATLLRLRMGQGWRVLLGSVVRQLVSTSSTVGFDALWVGSGSSPECRGQAMEGGGGSLNGAGRAGEGSGARRTECCLAQQAVVWVCLLQQLQ